MKSSVLGDAETALGQLLGYESSIVSRVKAYLRQTEHPSALPASWRLSAANRGRTRSLFHLR